MGKIIIPLVIILVALGAFLLLGEGKDTPKSGTSSENSTTTNTEETNMPFAGDLYLLSANDSVVNWTGRKTLIPNYEDTGTLNFVEGQFYMDEGVFTGGRAVFNMDSIKAVKTTIGKESDLDKHLRSEDFFAVANYPTAELNIKNVVAGETENQFNLSGELTIKGISQGVSFPATITQNGDTLTIEGETKLDRTLWDIRFGSDKFFDNLADNVIDDFFSVEFKVVANKQ